MRQSFRRLTQPKTEDIYVELTHITEVVQITKESVDLNREYIMDFQSLAMIKVLPMYGSNVVALTQVFICCKELLRAIITHSRNL